MTLLVSDDFNRADTTTGLGTTSVGAKAWSRNDSTFKIQSNRVQVSAGSGDPCTTVDAGQPNVTVQATLAVAGGDTSLVGRYTDDSNYWLAHVDTTGPVRLFKKVAGTYTQVSPTSGSGPNSGDIVQLVFSGNTVTMKVNGSTIFTTTDSFNNTATRAGFRAGTNVGGAAWDDFSVSTPASDYPGTVLNDAPVAYWHLDEATNSTTLADASGNGHPFSIPTGWTSVASGVTGGGTAMSVTNNPGSINSPGTWATGLTDFSVECWFKTTMTGSGVFFSMDDIGQSPGAAGRKFNFYTTGGTVVFMCFTNTGGYPYVQTAAGFNDGQWHHAVGTRVGMVQTLYVDGVQRGTITGSGAQAGSTVDLLIAASRHNAGGVDQMYTGSLDELAMYGTGLNSAQVSAHYTAGTATGPATASGTASLSATSSLSAAGTVTRQGATALSATSSLSAAPIGTTTAASALSATSALSVTVVGVKQGVGALSATSALSADGSITAATQSGDAALTATASLMATASTIPAGYSLVTYTYRPVSMNTDPVSPNTYGTVVGGTDASVLWTPDGDVSYVEVTHDAAAGTPGTQITFRWEPVGDAAPADVSTWARCAVSISHKQMSGPGTGWGSLDYHDPVTGNWGGNYGQDYSPGYPDVPTADGYVTQTQVLLPADLTTDGGFPHPVGPDSYWIYRMYGTYGTGGTSRLNYATLEVTALVPTPVPAEDWAPPTLEPNGFVTDTGATYLLAMMSGAEDAVDTYYLAVTKTLPTPFSDGQDLDEPDATDYHRLAVPNGSGWGRLGASFYNEVALTYAPTNDWGTYLGWAVLDSAQEGRVLFAGDLVDAVSAVSGTPFTIDRGKLAVALAVTDWALEG